MILRVHFFLWHSWNVPQTFLGRSWNVPGTFLGRSWNIPGMFRGHSWNVPSGQGWAGCSLDVPVTYFGIAKVLCWTFRKTDLHTGSRRGLPQTNACRNCALQPMPSPASWPSASSGCYSTRWRIVKKMSSHRLQVKGWALTLGWISKRFTPTSM